MASNKATLVSIFSQGDVPQGTDFANLINSQVNLAETALQSMNGPLQATELNAFLVSCANINTPGNLNVSSITITGQLTAEFNVSISGDVSANISNVYCSSTRYPLAVVISAVGTTQAQAQTAQLTFTMTRGQGATDGQATGFSLLANRIGWVQYFLYEGAVSANLWPPTGGTINAGSINVPFALAAKTSYTIFHIAASAYGVK